jgi:catechol 2,3-dioxygenase-like lactoylglutathione lyase family enzyme
MPGIHHTAIVTSDVDRARRFWCEGMGLTELMDHTFRGDWPTLFGSATDELRSVFLGDPATPTSGIVELVVFDGAEPGGPPTRAPRHGFFLVSLERDVEPTLATLAGLGFTDGVRRISMPAPGGRSVAMAVITAPDGVLVELIGAAADRQERSDRGMTP